MTDIKHKVGQQIREGRKKKGMTQKELGEKLGVSESAVNKYEAGKVNPSLDMLYRVSLALDAQLEVTIKVV